MSLLRTGLEPHLPIGVALSLRQWSQLQLHFELLLKWNRSLNLTAIRNPDEIISRHFLESLLLCDNLRQLAAGSLVLDIGSGGGFPGLPLAVVFPDLQFTLLDSHARKCVFLREVSLEWGNVRVCNQRLENLRDRFSLAVSRGVSWQSIASFLPLVADSIAFLSSAQEWEVIQKSADWNWHAPKSITSGDMHLIVSGDVSRGT
jgi:16S rRNA (guanine(527)-N(7))-methyltransferase RsmG